MISGAGRTITYAAFDKPTDIRNANGHRSVFSYNPDNTRFKRVDTDSNGTSTYHYVGGLFERVQLPNGSVEERNFIN